MITLTFDRNNPNWKKDKEWNMAFVLQQNGYLETLLMTRGYLYLNQIYESLGFKWDPNNENKCYKRGDVELEFFNMTEKRLLIVINDSTEEEA